jgi:hypothetical protein
MYTRMMFLLIIFNEVGYWNLNTTVRIYEGQSKTWRMLSSGMLLRVGLVRTDVSEELSTFFIRVTRIGELGTTLAVTSNRRTLRRNANYLASVVWFTMSPYRLDRLLLHISACKFYRGCARQFGACGATSSKDSGLCITKTHRATHRLLCSKSLQRKIPVFTQQL